MFDDDGDGKEKGPRKLSPKERRKRADARIARFPVNDLVTAIAARGDQRQRIIQQFVEGSPTTSYEGTRALMRRIYATNGAEDGVSEALFEDLPPEPWEKIEARLSEVCKPTDFDNNREISRLLFDHARSGVYRATNIAAVNLRISRTTVPMRLDFYVTEGSRLIFQFPHLRRSALSSSHANVLGSLLHISYVQGDFAGAEIEIVSASAPKNKPRVVTLRTLDPRRFIGREELGIEIDDVYRILEEIALGRD